MKNLYTFFLYTLGVFSIMLISACASIVSDKDYVIAFQSKPENARVRIIDTDGLEIFKGKTPVNVPLPAGAGYFKRARYTVYYELDGYEKARIPVNFKLDAWYIGNIAVGGIIGCLIVDPLTGAMYMPRKKLITKTLSPLGTEARRGQLQVFSLDEISEDWREDLVLIQK